MTTLIHNYEGLLTRYMSGVWAHCGAPTVYESHDECENEFCMNEVCSQGCPWDFPECVRDEEFCETVCHYCLSEVCQEGECVV